MTTVLNLNPITKLTREKFVKICEANPELQLERNPQGELIIMSPLGGESGRKEANLIFKISLWNN
ncbi:MAG TPA: Uma2 family endonuclease, partial [Allocoleopsis sp.]